MNQGSFPIRDAWGSVAQGSIVGGGVGVGKFTRSKKEKKMHIYNIFFIFTRLVAASGVP